MMFAWWFVRADLNFSYENQMFLSLQVLISVADTLDLIQEISLCVQVRWTLMLDITLL